MVDLLRKEEGIRDYILLEVDIQDFAEDTLVARDKILHLVSAKLSSYRFCFSSNWDDT